MLTETIFREVSTLKVKEVMYKAKDNKVGERLSSFIHNFDCVRYLILHHDQYLCLKILIIVVPFKLIR